MAASAAAVRLLRRLRAVPPALALRPSASSDKVAAPASRVRHARAWSHRAQRRPCSAANLARGLPPPLPRNAWSCALFSWEQSSPKGSRGEAKGYVGNLSLGVNNLVLANLFNEQGEVLEVRFIYDRESERSREFGFVTYASDE